MSNLDPTPTGYGVSLGDYVLATKYSDGDPGDPWYVGFVAGFLHNRILIADAENRVVRASGYRRAKRISRERGDWLLANKDAIAQSASSLWYWVHHPLGRPILKETT